MYEFPIHADVQKLFRSYTASSSKQDIKTIYSRVFAKAYFLKIVSDIGTKRLRVERTT